MNDLSKLNDVLFQQLERLNSGDLKGEELKSEIDRSIALTNVSTKVIDNAKLALDATKVASDLSMTGKNNAPKFLGIK